jgi:fibronectin type 3 domain-containing protein
VNAPSGASSLTYRVYRGVAAPEESNIAQDISKAKLKSPLEPEGSSSETKYRDVHFEFGTLYDYTVRSVAQYGTDFVESADSEPTLIAPRDILPPATPTGLETAIIPASPQGPAYVELSWAISTEEDLAGYFVYRSDREDTPGIRINAEIFPSPAFRDISVQPGKRYYYRVSALDRAGNESPMSAAVVADVP